MSFNPIPFIIWTVILSIFMLGFLFQKKGTDWRSLGVIEGFLVALFLEMFGIPLSIYILSSFFGMSGVSGTGNLRVDYLGKGPVQLFFMIPLFIFAVAGLLLICVGWYKIYHARDSLVTDGVYAYTRHPQYLGLMMVTFSLLLWWPTVLTLVMWPVLSVMYYFLGKREEKVMLKEFGKEYEKYRNKVNTLLPFPKRK